MWAATVLITSAILIGIAIQVFQTRRLLKLFHDYRYVPIPDSELPKAAIVFSLRGCDPNLNEHLESLLNQDYPDYHVFVVLDNENDPAGKLVKDVEERLKPNHLTVRVVATHSKTCSLMANNLATILPELAAGFDVIALVDADAKTWPQWLRVLVTPLVQSDLHVVYGNRWYMPRRVTFATLARFVWNFGSVQQMVLFQYPWGGSLAMKSEFVTQTDFVDVLKSSIANDTQIYSVSKKAGLKIAFHPGMMLINKEETDFSSFYFWMSRQMVYGRLYHPTWPIVLGIGMATAIILALALLINVYNLVTLDWLPFALLGGSATAHWLIWVAYLFRLDSIVGKQVASRGETRRWWDAKTAFLIVMVAPAVQFIFLGGLFKATFMRRAHWRGIDYEIKGPHEILMQGYHPFSETAGVDNQSVL